MKHLAVLLLLLLALPAAGCGGQDDGAASGTAAGPLRLQLWADPEEAEVWEELAGAYRGGEVRVDAVPDKDDHLQRLATAFAAGRPPDVMLVNHRDLGPFLAEGALADPGVDAKGLLPAPVGAFTVDDELKCAPLNASSLVVYLNLDRLREAGLTPPAGGRWTYDELVRTARRLRDVAGEDEHALGIDPGLIRAAPFVWSAGGDLVREDRFALDSPEAQRGLQALVQLRVDGLTPTRAEAEALGLEERFAAGRLGMLFSSRREVPQFRRLARFDWDVAGFPVIERPATVLHSDGLCVPANGSRVEAAQRFVQFAAGPEGQRVLARAGRTVPSLEAVARSTAFLDPAARPRSSRVFLEALPTLRALPTTPRFSPAEDAADDAIEEAFYGGLSIAEAVARLETVRIR